MKSGKIKSFEQSVIQIMIDEIHSMYSVILLAPFSAIGFRYDAQHSYRIFEELCSLGYKRGNSTYLITLSY